MLSISHFGPASWLEGLVVLIVIGFPGIVAGILVAILSLTYRIFAIVLGIIIVLGFYLLFESSRADICVIWFIILSILISIILHTIRFFHTLYTKKAGDIRSSRVQLELSGLFINK